MRLKPETQEAVAAALARLDAEIADHHRQIEELTRALDEKEDLAESLRHSLEREKPAEPVESAVVPRGPYYGLTLIKAVELAARTRGRPLTVAELAKLVFDGGYRGAGTISSADRVRQNIASLFVRKRGKADFPLESQSNKRWAIKGASDQK